METIDVDVEVPRELKQHGAKRRAQSPRASQKQPQRRSWVLELLHVREITARLDGEDEPWWGRAPPCLEGGAVGKR
jgi:hypothetical protein